MKTNVNHRYDRANQPPKSDAQSQGRRGGVSLKWLALGFCGAIVVLSTVTGDIRPHTALPGPAEHAIAYAGTAATLALAYRKLHERIWALLFLVSASVLLECAQLYVPGRNACVIDAMASMSGVALGVTLGVIAAALTKNARSVLGH